MGDKEQFEALKSELKIDMYKLRDTISRDIKENLKSIIDTQDKDFQIIIEKLKKIEQDIDKIVYELEGIRGDVSEIKNAVSDNKNSIIAMIISILTLVAQIYMVMKIFGVH